MGRIYDWYQKNQPQSEYQVDSDPGVVSVRQIYQYYKSHGYDTVVMGASFRRIEQIQALAGCDRLTISPALLDELAASEGALSRQLAPGCVTETRPSPITQAEFLWQHHQDPMAVEKLAEGIRLFAVDQVKLENQIQQKQRLQRKKMYVYQMRL